MVLLNKNKNKTRPIPDLDSNGWADVSTAYLMAGTDTAPNLLPRIVSGCATLETVLPTVHSTTHDKAGKTLSAPPSSRICITHSYTEGGAVAVRI